MKSAELLFKLTKRHSSKRPVRLRVCTLTIWMAVRACSTTVANAQPAPAEKPQASPTACDGAALSRRAEPYYFGRGVPQDYQRAFELLQKATDCGDADAMASLGYLYQSGAGVQQDIPHAVELYKKSAELGSALGIYSVGLTYYRLVGFPTNYVIARQLFEKAAAGGIR